MHDDSALVLPRIERFFRERLLPAVYRDRVPAQLTAWTAPGEPVPFAEAVRQEFTPFAPGTAWGRPWGTVWFHVTGSVPAGWTDPATRPELVVDLGFSSAVPGFQAEGLAYTPAGAVVAAVEPMNTHVPLPGGAGSAVDLYVEAASNPNLGGDWSYAPTPLGDLVTAGTEPIYRLAGVDVALLDLPVWELTQDVWTLSGLVSELPADLPRRAEVLRALERRCGRGRPGRRLRHGGAGPGRAGGRAGAARRTPARTGCTPSGTRTSTLRGSGRCARPYARWRGRSPTCCR